MPGVTNVLPCRKTMEVIFCVLISSFIRNVTETVIPLERQRERIKHKLSALYDAIDLLGQMKRKKSDLIRTEKTSSGFI